MLEKIRDRLADQLGIDETEITLDAQFKEDLGADSLDLMEMVMGLEDEYGIEIPVEELEQIETIGDLVEYLASEGITE